MASNIPLYSTEEISNLPILIVDKKGIMGTDLARRFSREALVVLVTKFDSPIADNIIHIPYRRKIPSIPDNHYAQFFVIYNGEQEILDMLPSLVKRSIELKISITFITSLENSSKHLFTTLSHYQNASLQIMLYGETFDESTHHENPVSTLLHEARVYGRIALPNAGLLPIYPIAYPDVIEIIAIKSFQLEKKFQLYYLFSPTAFSQIALARSIQKHIPLLKIDFTKKKVSKKNYFIPSGGVPLIHNYDIDTKMKALHFIHTETIPSIVFKKKKKVTFSSEDKQKSILVIMTFLFSIFIVPIVIAAIFLLSGVGFLSLSLKQLDSGNITSAKHMANTAKYAFHATEILVPGLVLPNLLFPHQTAQVVQKAKIGSEIVEVEQDGIGAFVLLQQILHQKSADPHEDFLKATATLKNTMLTFQKMRAENKLPMIITAKVSAYEGIVGLAEDTIDIWPALFGFEGERVYLLLFQNNMELRPGGGFIGSYGIISVKNGIFSKLQIFDVYDADGKLTNHVPPPYGLKRFMGSSHWFLRDSNFSVDFVENAEKASQFLTLETGKHVDGVVAIDTSFLKGILSVVGSVKVPDYNDVVTPDNFYLLTQTRVEKDFFPGSTQKKDFLRNLMQAMLIKMFDERKFEPGKLALTIDQAIKQKHLLISSADNAQQDIFSLTGLSSSLIDTRKAKNENTFFDFLGVVDANIGANKVNYYLQRSISQDIRFGNDGSIQGLLGVTYKNESTPQSPFGGDYKNYVQIILPQGAILQSLFFDGDEQTIAAPLTDAFITDAQKYVSERSVEVEQKLVKQKNVFGFYLSVPQGKQKKVTVTYRIPDVFDTTASAFYYNLLLFKQPGTQADHYNVTFTFPSDLQLMKTDNSLVNLGGKGTFETILDTDKKVSLIFSKR